MRDDDEQYEHIARLVSEWLADGVDESTIAVLVRSNDRAADLRKELAKRGVTVNHVKSARADSAVPVVLTLHTSKGMEFSRVILFDVSDGVMPNAHIVSLDSAAEDLSDLKLRERSLLYVGSSRARDALVVTWKGEPSELLASLNASGYHALTTSDVPSSRGHAPPRPDSIPWGAALEAHAVLDGTPTILCRHRRPDGECVDVDAWNDAIFREVVVNAGRPGTRFTSMSTRTAPATAETRLSPDDHPPLLSRRS